MPSAVLRPAAGAFMSKGQVTGGIAVEPVSKKICLEGIRIMRCVVVGKVEVFECEISEGCGTER